VPTVTASTIIADLELADKVGRHNRPVEIPEAAWVRRGHPRLRAGHAFSTTTEAGAGPGCDVARRAGPLHPEQLRDHLKIRAPGAFGSHGGNVADDPN
jgi:hypothetical protein